MRVKAILVQRMYSSMTPTRIHGHNWTGCSPQMPAIWTMLVRPFLSVDNMPLLGRLYIILEIKPVQHISSHLTIPTPTTGKSNKSCSARTLL